MAWHNDNFAICQFDDQSSNCVEGIATVVSFADTSTKLKKFYSILIHSRKVSISVTRCLDYLSIFGHLGQ